MKTKSAVVATLAASLLIASANAQQAPARKIKRPATTQTLLTRWAKDVSDTAPLPEYPRPQMAREAWLNLNGVWEFAEAAEGAAVPAGQALKENILVPFPVESYLSGVQRQVKRMDYRRTFEVPAKWSGKRVVLNFGAVDWQSDVYVNGKHLGTHHGGYDPFSYDVTDALKASGENELIVRVFDPTDEGSQPRGKQVNKPHGIFYTPCSGIWQTVWLEDVPQAYVGDVKIAPDVDQQTVTVTATTVGGAAAGEVTVVVKDGGKEVARGTGGAGQPITVKVPDAKLWTPESPHLYDLTISAGEDTVGSYFGMRKSGMAKDEKGVNRLMLNGKPVFHMGPLDQGYWPDGNLTAPTDAALKYDIEVTKELGFNTIRKHVKVEPARWYYWADKLGILVWQDMPSGDNKTAESKKQFEAELDRMIRTHWNSPSIVMWVPFNEGWGQYDSDGCARVVEQVKKLDPSRVVNEASGWNNYGHGDVSDMHKYPMPGMNKVEDKRASVLGEYGGLGLFINGHTWSANQFSYQGMEDAAALTRNYVRFMGRVWELEKQGLAAAIYTQTTDVETEMNGLLTYDRAIIKPDVTKIRDANQGKAPAIVMDTVLATSQEKPADWRYTFSNPGAGWEKEGYADGEWKTGPGGFGTEGTPGAAVRTVWSTGDIWIRRTFELRDEPGKDLMFMIHHDEAEEVYVNGVLAARNGHPIGEYQEVAIRKEGLAALRKGKNTIAVHCKNTTGGQYIDVGLVRWVEKKADAK
jgi:hypothetical protein